MHTKGEDRANGIIKMRTSIPRTDSWKEEGEQRIIKHNYLKPPHEGAGDNSV